ncbi:MAG: hypothetical protein QOH04_3198 [Sphingomonadales bacterium]|nr:hypothetical protein [Sphingomonadales bacterium]
MPRPGKAEGIAPKRTSVRAPAGSSDPAWDPPSEELRAGLPACGPDEAAEGRSSLRSRARGERKVRLALEPRRRKRVRLLPEPGEAGGFALLWSRQAGRRVSAQIPADGKRRSVRAPCATHGSRTRFRLAPEPTHPAGDRPASAARSGAWDFGGWRRRRPPCCFRIEVVLRAGAATTSWLDLRHQRRLDSPP